MHTYLYTKPTRVSTSISNQSLFRSLAPRAYSGLLPIQAALLCLLVSYLYCSRIYIRMFPYYAYWSVYQCIESLFWSRADLYHIRVVYIQSHFLLYSFHEKYKKVFIKTTSYMFNHFSKLEKVRCCQVTFSFIFLSFDLSIGSGVVS